MRGPLLIARAILTAVAFALLSGCVPYRVEPAVGTSLRYEFCGAALPSTVYVYIRNAKCPDLAKVQIRAERIEQRYNVKLAGVKVYVNAAVVACDDADVFGCQSGDSLSVTSNVYVYGLIQHEMAHAAVDRRFGGDFEQWLVDHPEERIPFRRHTGDTP